MANKVFELLYCRHVGLVRLLSSPFRRDAVLGLEGCGIVGPVHADTVFGKAALCTNITKRCWVKSSGIQPKVVGCWVLRVAESRCDDRNGVQPWKVVGDDG